MLFLLVGCFVVFFFFSSRRRHTRCGRDWSSDVCSSDLDRPRPARLRGTDSTAKPRGTRPVSPTWRSPACSSKIGRASCRERVQIPVVGGGLKKKKLSNGITQTAQYTKCLTLISLKLTKS